MAQNPRPNEKRLRARTRIGAKEPRSPTQCVRRRAELVEGVERRLIVILIERVELGRIGRVLIVDVELIMEPRSLWYKHQSSPVISWRPSTFQTFAWPLLVFRIVVCDLRHTPAYRFSVRLRASGLLTDMRRNSGYTRRNNFQDRLRYYKRSSFLFPPSEPTQTKPRRLE